MCDQSSLLYTNYWFFEHDYLYLRDSSFYSPLAFRECQPSPLNVVRFNKHSIFGFALLLRNANRPSI